MPTYPMSDRERIISILQNYGEERERTYDIEESVEYFGLAFVVDRFRDREDSGSEL